MWCSSPGTETVAITGLVVLPRYKLQSSQRGGGRADEGTVFGGSSQRTRARQRGPLPSCLGAAAGGNLTLLNCPLSCHRLLLQFLWR